MLAALRSILEEAGIAIHRTRGRYARDGLYTIHSAGFLRDPGFQAAYARGIRASAGVDPRFEWRVHVALWAAQTALGVAGDFVECGVNAGFMSSAILHHLNWNSTGRAYHLIDTFGGPVLDQFSPQEVEEGRRAIAESALAAGAYVTDIERVRGNFAEWPAVRIHQGAVPEILPAAGITAVAFLHIDMNCAEPERQALEFFWPHLSLGGIILLDDYAYYGHGIQKAAIDATASALGCSILSLPTGQGMISKSNGSAMPSGIVE